VHQELISHRNDLSHFFKYLDRVGTPRLGANGEVWLDFPVDSGTARHLGLSPSTILASGSDPLLSYELALARAGYFLRSPKHSRETMPEFETDWNLVHSARLLHATLTPPAAQTSLDARAGFPTTSGNQ
jgi:hypothetical protein